MSIRQQRLKDLLSHANNNWCFEVFIAVSKTINTNEEYEWALQKYGFEALRDQEGQINLPRNYRDKNLYAPYLYSKNGFKAGLVHSTETLFFQSPYNVPDFKEFARKDHYIHHSHAYKDCRAIVERYLPNFTKHFPDFIFNKGNEENYAATKTGNQAVEFKYLLHPYDPVIHPPHQNGILRPITLFDRKEIHPTNVNLKGFTP